MKPHREVRVRCSDVEAALLQQCATGPVSAAEARKERLDRSPPGAALDPELRSHIEQCGSCRATAEEIRRLERDLEAGFARLAGTVPAPSEERIRAAIRGASAASPEAVLLRRIRRPIRFFLWYLLFGLSLVGCVWVAWALYHAKLH
jgi:hypothetical protein